MKELVLQFKSEGHQAQDSKDESMSQFKSEGCLLAEFPLAQERSVFVLFKLSTNWTKPTTLWRAICFTTSPQIYFLSF